MQKSYETYNENTGLGKLYLKPDMWFFLVKKENLNPDKPILDLSGRSVIRYEIESRLKPIHQIQSTKVNPKVYSSFIHFRYSPKCIEQQRFYLDSESTHQINILIRHLRNELLHENVLQYAQNNGIALHENYHERKAGIKRIQEGIKIQNIFLEAEKTYGDSILTDWEALKRAEYRLRTLRRESSTDKKLLTTFDILMSMLAEKK